MGGASLAGLAGRIAVSALWRPERQSYGLHPSQVADLHVPPGDGPFPVAVVLHGGYWQARYGKLVTRPLAGDLARHGWAAWNLEYRRVGAGGGWPATFEDVAAGIDALRALEDPRLDLSRVVAAGHSAGGHLALWAGARPGLPAGAPGAAPEVELSHVVALAAVSHLAAAGSSGRALMGGGPDAVAERYAQADPRRLMPLAVPVLLIHPGDDAVVPVKQSREYAQAAAASGGDVTLLEPVTGGHNAPLDPRSKSWRAAREWLRQRIGAAAGSGR